MLKLLTLVKIFYKHLEVKFLPLYTFTVFNDGEAIVLVSDILRDPIAKTGEKSPTNLLTIFLFGT